MSEAGDARPSVVDTTAAPESRQKNNKARRFVVAGAGMLALLGAGESISACSVTDNSPVQIHMDKMPDSLTISEKVKQSADALMQLSLVGHPETHTQGVFMHGAKDQQPFILAVVPKDLEHGTFEIRDADRQRLTLSAHPMEDASEATDAAAFVRLDLTPAEAARESHITPLRWADPDSLGTDMTAYTILPQREVVGGESIRPFCKRTSYSCNPCKPRGSPRKCHGWCSFSK